MPQFLLFSTTNVNSGRSAHLQRMIEGVEAAKKSDPALDIHLLLLLQKCPPEVPNSGFPSWITVSRTEKQISLSAARNGMISEAIAKNLVTEDSIYAFPDDDSWYTPELLSMIAHLFHANPALDFWFCKYGSTPASVQSLTTVKPTLQQVISRGSSNTIFFRGSLLQQMNHFDGSLGVGAELNGGEDTEYAIRAYYAAKSTLFTEVALVGHRDPDPTLRPKYFPGTLRAISRHRHRSAEGWIAYMRKIGVGAALVSRRQMKLSVLLSALRNA